MRPALAARAVAVLHLLGTASALVVEGEDVDQPRAELTSRLSLEEREKLEAEDWNSLVGGAGLAAVEAHAKRQQERAVDEEEDWERLEAEDWARVEAERRAAEQARLRADARPASGHGSPPGNAAAAATPPASKGQGLLRWIRMKLRRGEQPAAPTKGAADARPQVSEPAPEPITHSSRTPPRGGVEAASSSGVEAAQEAKEPARQTAVDNFLDNLEQPSDSALDSLDRAYSTTSSLLQARSAASSAAPAVDSFPEPRVEPTTTAKLLESEAAPTRPPPVFCPSPDQVREQEAREAGQKRGGRDVGLETSSPGCSPEERLKTAAQLEKSFADKWRSSVADVFSQEESGTYLSIGDWRAGPLLGNWLSHAGRAGDVEGGIHLVNVALDKGGMTGCRNLQRAMEAGSAVRLTCVSLAGWLPDRYFEGDTHMGSCDYNMILWTKPNILKAAVESSQHAVLMIDTDVLLYKDLLKLGKQKFARNSDKKLITGREKNNQANTGTVYATRWDSMPFLEAWVRANNKCLNGQMGDQSAMQHVIHYEPGMRLALETFQRGEVGECAIKGKYATHYNCVGNKHKAMRENEEWAEGVSTKPEEIAGPNPVIALHQRLSDSE